MIIHTALACSSLHLVIYFSLVHHLLFLCSFTFVVHLFSIYASFHVYTCSPFVFNLFSLHPFIHFPTFVFHLSSFILHSFFISFSFILHLFFICPPFIFNLFSSSFLSPHLFHECGSCAVRARISFCRTELIFPSKFPRNRRMDVKAERKVFPKRLCTSDWLLRRGSCSYPNRNARTPTPWYSSSSTSCTYTYRMFNVFIAFPFEPIRNRIFLARLLFRKNTGTKYINNLLNRI